jgi:hypothetical protein
VSLEPVPHLVTRPRQITDSYPNQLDAGAGGGGRNSINAGWLDDGR